MSITTIILLDISHAFQGAFFVYSKSDEVGLGTIHPTISFRIHELLRYFLISLAWKLDTSHSLLSLPEYMPEKPSHLHLIIDILVIRNQQIDIRYKCIYRTVKFTVKHIPCTLDETQVIKMKGP